MADDDDDVAVAYFPLQQMFATSAAASVALDSRPPNAIFYHSEDNDDILPLQKRCRLKKRMIGLRTTMADQCHYTGGPTQPLQRELVLAKLFADPNRNYAKIIIGFFGWEFFCSP